MLMPSIFGENLFDDFFDSSFKDFGSSELMRTDVKEGDNHYEMIINMPGVQKENVKAELKDGYLIVQATSNQDNDEKDKTGRYIRRERYSGSCSRSFYVGKSIKEEDIRAKFENGTLRLIVPKEDAKAVEQSKYISIEG